MLNRKLLTAVCNKAMHIILEICFICKLECTLHMIMFFTTPGHIGWVRLQSPTNGRPSQPTYSVLLGSSFLWSLCGSKWLNPFYFKMGKLIGYVFFWPCDVMVDCRWFLLCVNTCTGYIDYITTLDVYNGNIEWVMKCPQLFKFEKGSLLT